MQVQRRAAQGERARACELVSMELSSAPVCVFQNLMQRSAVPPPEASRLACTCSENIRQLQAGHVSTRVKRTPKWLEKLMQACRSACTFPNTKIHMYLRPTAGQLGYKGLNSSGVYERLQGELDLLSMETLRAGPEDARLEGAPRQRLDRGAVRGQALRGPRAVRVPNVQHVVVAATGQLRAAGRPLQPAHLLLVPAQRGRDVLAHPARLQSGPTQLWIISSLQGAFNNRNLCINVSPHWNSPQQANHTSPVI